jgi:transcriptional regulator with XRE-family HTH domain
MAVDIPAIREIAERVCTRQDVLDACKRRDLGFVVRVLCAHGITQGQIAALTGITQGRLSEYKTGKRIPTATSTFEAFADGLGLPAAARRALGLTSEAAGSGPSDQAGGRSADIAGASSGDLQPLLSNLSRASAVPVLSALREVHRGYIEADRLMGSICITGPISLQMPVVERACEVTRGRTGPRWRRRRCLAARAGRPDGTRTSWVKRAIAARRRSSVPVIAIPPGVLRSAGGGGLGRATSRT